MGSAMHSQDGEEESYAQVTRARTRPTVHQRPRRAHLLSAPTTESDRSPVDKARQRWAWGGTATAPELDAEPEEEPGEAAGPAAPAAPGQAGGEATAVPRPEPRAPLAAPPAHLSPFSSWSGASLPVRATWATYVHDGLRAREKSLLLLFGYAVIAIPAFPLHCLFRLAQDSTTSVTRTVIFAITMTILIIGILVAL